MTNVAEKLVPDIMTDNIFEEHQLIQAKKVFRNRFIKYVDCIQDIGLKYPHPNTGQLYAKLIRKEQPGLLLRKKKIATLA